MAGKNRPLVYSRRLCQAREAAGLSQRALGVMIGIHPDGASTRINRYERGVHQPDLSIQKLLAEALETPLPFFYAEEEELAKLIMDFCCKRRPRNPK